MAVAPASAASCTLSGKGKKASDARTLPLALSPAIRWERWTLTTRLGCPFVLDRDGVIRHAEYVPEVADHPNYDSALQCARQLAG